MVEFESQNELAAFRYLETNPCVHGYWEQPCVVYYVDGAIERKYYPDICIHYEDRKELWEVKAAPELANEDLIYRTRLLTPALADWGFDYRLVVGEVLMQQPQYANIQLLLRHRRRSVSIREYESLRLTAQKLNRLTWGKASAGNYGPNGRAILSTLTIAGFLSVDLSKRIEGGAEFRMREEVQDGRR